MGNLKGVLRYERAPSNEFMAALQGPLAFLLDTGLRAGKHAVDPQLRENNRLMLYTGSTCVLAVQHFSGGRLAFAAADRYRQQHMEAATGALLFVGKGASDEQHKRVQPFTLRSPNLKETILAYLSSVDITKNWLGKESDVQMRARLVRDGEAWWHLDREGVLGGGLDTAEAGGKVAAAWADLLCTPAFAKRKPSRPEGLQRAKEQDELDQIGIDKQGRLVLAELKYGGAGSVATFIYAAPMQLLRYAWAWDAALNDEKTRGGIQRLLDAKRALFPEFYRDAPERFVGGLRTIVGFGDRLRQDAEVQEKFWAAVASAERHLPDSVQPQRIEVWNITSEGVATPACRPQG